MDLKELLLKQKEEEAKKKEDAKPQMTKEMIIERFRSFVIQFIDKVVGDWLKELMDEGLVQCDPFDIEISEERLGTYSVVGLKTQIGKTEVVFRPVGTEMIGTIGRIDMIVNNRSIQDCMFILAPQKAKSPRIRVITWVEGEEKPKMPKEEDLGPLEWKYVERTDRMQYVSLNKESFQQVILKHIL